MIFQGLFWLALKKRFGDLVWKNIQLLEGSWNPKFLRIGIEIEYEKSSKVLNVRPWTQKTFGGKITADNITISLSLDTPGFAALRLGRLSGDKLTGNVGRAHYTMVWYPKFNGSHFGLPPSSIPRMTGLGGKTVCMMTYLHRSHFLVN